jgi:hypothetical protein
MVHVDALKKAEFLVLTMHGARALADLAEDPMTQRTLARPVLGRFHEFLDWIGAVVKPLRSDLRHRALAREADRLIRPLRNRDWPDYTPLRHQIAVHRQAFLPEDTSSGMAQIEAASRMWVELDQATIHILTDDAAEVYNMLASELGGRPVAVPFTALPAIAERVRAALPTAGEGLRVDAGSFGDAIQDTITVSASGAVSERLRQVVDVVRSVQLFGQLAASVQDAPPLGWPVIGAVFVDVCTLVDLVYGRPYPTAHSVTPLIDLIAADARPGEPGLPILTAGRSDLSSDAYSEVKWLRDKVHGHLDAVLPWPDIEKHLLAPVPASLDVVTGNLFDTLGHAAAEDLRFWPIKLLDARMSDVRRVDQPPMARPYET